VLTGCRLHACQNAIFMKPDATSHVVEIVNEDLPDPRECYRSLVNGNNQTLWRVKPLSMASYDWGTITADVPAVVAVLRRIGVADSDSRIPTATRMQHRRRRPPRPG
jgi:hypothetical protein